MGLSLLLLLLLLVVELLDLIVMGLLLLWVRMRRVGFVFHLFLWVELIYGYVIFFCFWLSLDERLGRLFKVQPPIEDAYVYKHNKTPPEPTAV